MTVVFYGTPAFAVPTLTRLLASPHRVVGVVTQPDRPRGRGRKVTPSPVKRLTTTHDLPLFQPARIKSEAFLADLAALRADVAVVAAYGRILPDPVLAAPRLGTINVHASLLPRYRGAAPVHRAVMAGERETGVTIIRLVAEMDAGPMLARRPHAIGPDETSDVVEQALAHLGADLLVTTVDALASGTSVEEPQDPAAATYAPRLTRDDGRIDWHARAAVIHDQIRGLHPWPHAYSHLDGRRYLMHRSRIASATAPHVPPGTVVEAAGDHLVVATGDAGALAITEIQPEGRRPQATRAFLAGHPWTAGLRFDRPAR